MGRLTMNHLIAPTMVPIAGMSKAWADYFRQQAEQLATLTPRAPILITETRCVYCATKQTGKPHCDSCGAPQ